jgi:hypothetical protein
LLPTRAKEAQGWVRSRDRDHRDRGIVIRAMAEA